MFQIPRDLPDHPSRTFLNCPPKKKKKNSKRKKENEPASFSCHFYQSSTFHHHVGSQSCYKPTADTSNALSTVWPNSSEMKSTIIQNSHLLWVMSHSWKEGNNTIVQEKGHFSCSPGCLHRSKAGYALRRKPYESLWWTQASLEILTHRQKPKHCWWTTPLKPFCWPLSFWIPHTSYIVLFCFHNLSFGFRHHLPKLGWEFTEGRSCVHLSSVFLKYLCLPSSTERPQ